MFPGSRHLVKRSRAEEDASQPKAKARKAAVPVENTLNPKTLQRDLENKCGARVVLAGKRLDVFRHESAQWHGALPNASDAPRSVLIWSYRTRVFSPVFGVTK